MTNRQTGISAYDRVVSSISTFRLRLMPSSALRFVRPDVDGVDVFRDLDNGWWWIGVWDEDSLRAIEWPSGATRFFRTSMAAVAFARRGGFSGPIATTAEMY